MIFHFSNKLPQLNAYWDRYLAFQQRLEVPAKTVLLEEGKVSQHYIFIEQGCVRAFLYKDGEDKTVQFFFEHQGLASLESFINNTPSLFSIETIEPSVVYLLPRQYVLQLMDELSHEPDFLQMMMHMMAGRQTHYMHEFVSFIRDTPEERYQRLLKDRPHHLSRIKSKLAKGKPHF
jgi:CRP-like cAMP-binding protein